MLSRDMPRPDTSALNALAQCYEYDWKNGDLQNLSTYLWLQLRLQPGEVLPNMIDHLFPAGIEFNGKKRRKTEQI